MWQMQVVFDQIPRLDGNFVRDFQTTGFDARVWELYLFAWANASGYEVRRPYDSPDYLVVRKGHEVWLEAVTANPTVGQPQPVRLDPNDHEYLEAVRNRDFHQLPIKFGSPLFSKLKKKYWELPPVQGTPLVFALSDFHDPSPARHSSHPLAYLL